jgi:hypothetical protein
VFGVGASVSRRARARFAATQIRTPPIAPRKTPRAGSSTLDARRAVRCYGRGRAAGHGAGPGAGRSVTLRVAGIGGLPTRFCRKWCGGPVDAGLPASLGRVPPVSTFSLTGHRKRTGNIHLPILFPAPLSARRPPPAAVLVGSRIGPSPVGVCWALPYRDCRTDRLNFCARQRL